MPALSGKVGKIQFKAATKTLGIRGWTFDMDTNMTEVTSWTTGTEQWRSFVPGLTGAVGTFTGFFDSSSTGQENMRIAAGLSTDVVALTTGTMQLYTDRGAGEHLSASIFFTGQSFAADIDGTVTYDGTFRVNGAVTWATST